MTSLRIIVVGVGGVGVGDVNGRWIEVLPGEAVLVVVHPDLKDSPLHPDFLAELLNHRLLLPLDLPPDLLRKAQHLLLLLLGEFRPEPLLHHLSRSRSRRRHQCTSPHFPASSMVLVLLLLVRLRRDQRPGHAVGHYHLVRGRHRRRY